MARALFVDKDGTLVENVPYNVDPRRIRLAAGAGPALRSLASRFDRLIVVSNQPGVARGHFPASALAGVERALAERLHEHGVRLDGFYWCPHHPDGCVPEYATACRCRKPAPGLLQRAARDHGVELAGSWMVGDILDDVEAGRRAGCRAVLIDNGGETEWVRGPWRTPHLVARDLAEAARGILDVLAGEASVHA